MVGSLASFQSKAPRVSLLTDFDRQNSLGGKKSVRRHCPVQVRHAPAVLEWLWLLLGTLRLLLRDRHALLVENLLLRQRLAVALRARPRPRLRRRDRLFWTVFRRVCTEWRRHLVLVRPETVLRWHRRG
jgi:hypothetical protein